MCKVSVQSTKYFHRYSSFTEFAFAVFFRTKISLGQDEGQQSEKAILLYFKSTSKAPFTRDRTNVYPDENSSGLLRFR